MLLIRTQMCRMFCSMYEEIQKGTVALPTRAQILEEAADRLGIEPYLNLWHPEGDDCRIGIFAPAWVEWLKPPAGIRFLSQLINPERAAKKAAAFGPATARGFGFHEIGEFSIQGRKSMFVEAVSLPAQPDGAVSNMFNFAIPIANAAMRPSGQAAVCRWLDLGNGVPSAPPLGTLALVA